MVHPAPTRRELVTAYRNLSQLVKHAVKNAQPARTTLQLRLQVAFRTAPPTDYDPARIRNMYTFLWNAGAHPYSLESKVVRRLAFTWWWDQEIFGHREIVLLQGWSRFRWDQEMKKRDMMRVRWTRDGTLAIREKRMEFFRFTVRMLNETMGLCLR